MALNASADDKVVNPDSTGFKFTDVKVIWYMLVFLYKYIPRK